MNVWDKVATGVAVFILSLIVLTMFVFVPVVLHTEARCLEAGYPRAKVTITLEKYCISLEGSSATKVTKLK
jgi:hypothetical protein